jgi:uncharacterized membrane protein
MKITFTETINLPVEQVYSYFPTPHDWQRLYGAFGSVKDRGDGWYAVPLRGVPFPLVARIIECQPHQRVAWELKGFWQGRGEVNFAPAPGGVTVSGFEEIRVGPVPLFSRALEKAFLEKKFRAVWESGWRRLRREARSQSDAEMNAKLPATPNVDSVSR